MIYFFNDVDAMIYLLVCIGQSVCLHCLCWSFQISVLEKRMSYI